MKIPEGAIYSEDGKYILGVKERKDRYGKIRPEAEWMYKRAIPVINLANLKAGKSEEAIQARKDSYEDRYAAFLAGLERGCMRTEAAKKARIAWSTVRERIKTDPAFAETVREAEAVADEKVLDVVWKDIVENGNSALGVKWLEKRNPDWRDKRVVETTNTQRLEIDASDRVGGIMQILERLTARKELAEGTVIDVESSEA